MTVTDYVTKSTEQQRDIAEGGALGKQQRDIHRVRGQRETESETEKVHIKVLTVLSGVLFSQKDQKLTILGVIFWTVVTEISGSLQEASKSGYYGNGKPVP